MGAAMTKVVNIKHSKYDVYIGRGSDWGNPFTHIRSMMTRQEAIEAYRVYLTTERPDLMARLSELKGKVLGCHCRPDSCHGDILVKLANELP